MNKALSVPLLLLCTTLSIAVHAQTHFPTLSKNQTAVGVGYQHHSVSTIDVQSGVFGYSGNIVKLMLFYAYRENLIFSASAGFTSVSTDPDPPMASALYSDAAIVYQYVLPKIAIGFFAKGAISTIIKGETETYPYLESYATRLGGGLVYKKISRLRPFWGIFYENRRGHLSIADQAGLNVSKNFVLTEVGLGIELTEQLNLAGSMEVPFNASEVVIRINTNYKF